MNRALLCSAIEGLVSQCGYSYTSSNETHYPTTICCYPAAFMPQPEFHSLEGRKHGRITYKIALTLACQAAKLSPSKRNELFDQMEQQMTEIFLGLSQHEFVAVVKDLTIKPVEEIDAHGAIAMKAQAYVETIF